MDRLIYLAMSGAKATLQRQDVLANNLANASTNGFRAELAAFRAVPVRGDGASTRVFAIESTPGYDSRPGQIQSTGRDLDVAMTGQAWLAVQGLDGTEAYTRGGALDVDADGLLKTAGGLTVLGDGGPISIPAGAAVAIATDGTITATVGAGRPQPVGRLKLVTPEAQLTRGPDGLFRAVARVPIRKRRSPFGTAPPMRRTGIPAMPHHHHRAWPGAGSPRVFHSDQAMPPRISANVTPSEIAGSTLATIWFQKIFAPMNTSTRARALMRYLKRYTIAASAK